MNVSGSTVFVIMFGVFAAFICSSLAASSNCPLHCNFCNSSQCFSCATGFYGIRCQFVCNNCQSGTKCNKDTGFCDLGCKDGLTGKHCDVSCDRRCHACSRDSKTDCVTCKNNQSCELTCPSNCQRRSCNGSYCTEGCLPGYWGHSCEKDCPSNCSSVGCERENGTCPEESEGPAGSNAFEVVVSILSISIVILAGVAIFTVFKKRKLNHREKKTAVNQPHNATNRCHDNRISPNANAWEFDNDSFENTQETEARNSTAIQAKEAVDVVTYEYAIPDGTDGRKQVADINEELDERCLSEEIKLAGTIDVADTYYNTVALRERQISVQALAEYVNKMSDEDYQEEFERLPSVLVKPCNEALREENVLKNRYRGIYPYDVTRVIISIKTSDYINANYIDGYNERRRYIASVGPTIKFMGDMSVFWRVVWQENCRTIVMLTRLLESEVIKCDEYWPDKHCAKCFGNLCITGVAEEHFDTYVTRTLQIERFQSIGDTEGAATRTIRQFHYLSWADKDLPENASSLIDLLDAVNASRAKGDGPILVHCSAGIGRTGTFIALDILTNEGKTTGLVDIYACVRNLREQRVKMVQTMAQYKFLHQALVYSFGKRDSSTTPAFSAKL